MALGAESGEYRSRQHFTEGRHVVARGEFAETEKLRRQEWRFVEHVENVAKPDLRYVTAQLEHDTRHLTRAEWHEHSNDFAYAGRKRRGHRVRQELVSGDRRNHDHLRNCRQPRGDRCGVTHQAPRLWTFDFARRMLLKDARARQTQGILYPASVRAADLLDWRWLRVPRHSRRRLRRRDCSPGRRGAWSDGRQGGRGRGGGDGRFLRYLGRGWRREHPEDDRSSDVDRLSRDDDRNDRAADVDDVSQ